MTFFSKMTFSQKYHFFTKKSQNLDPPPTKKSPPDLEISWVAFEKLHWTVGRELLTLKFEKLWKTPPNDLKVTFLCQWFPQFSSISAPFLMVLFSFDASRCALSESVLRIAIWSHLISFHCDLVVHKIFRPKTSLVVAGLRPIQSDSQAMGPI